MTIKAKPKTSTNEGLNEADFLARYDANAFEHPSVAVDVALVTVHEDQLRVLLLQRDSHPYKGAWALPGGFVGMKESLDSAAERVLREKAGIQKAFVEQLYTFGAPARDPRTRVISVAYYALVEYQKLQQLAQKPSHCLATLVVPWQGEAGGPVKLQSALGQPLRTAFDHQEVLGVAVQRLRAKVDYAPLGFQLLPKAFTLLDLQRVHETILGRSLNKDSFRRRTLASGRLRATGVMEQAVGHRPAEHYQYVPGITPAQ